MATRTDLRCTVSARRQAVGLTLTELAARAGISRQALTAIEAGRAVPSTAIALALARLLSCRVEDLFALADPAVRARAHGAPAGSRVVLGRVAEQWVAHAVDPRGALPADGIAGADGTVAPLDDPRRLARTALLGGCAPVLGLLAAQLSADSDAGGGRWVPGTSRDSLELLATDRVHVAGLHLAAADDARAHERLVAERLPGVAVDIVGLVTWREGLVVAPGNPLGIGGVGDLARPGLRIAHRPPGAGATAVLRQALAPAGLASERFPGPQVASHLDAAMAVLHGAADVAVVVEPVAEAFALPFLALYEERFELVVRARDRAHPGVVRLLDRLQEARFAREVQAMGAYDTCAMGSARRLEVA